MCLVNTQWLRKAISLKYPEVQTEMAGVAKMARKQNTQREMHGCKTEPLKAGLTHSFFWKTC